MFLDRVKATAHSENIAPESLSQALLSAMLLTHLQPNLRKFGN
jgi:hypothetical protein